MADDYNAIPMKTTIDNINHYYDDNNNDMWSRMTQHAQSPCEIYQIAQNTNNVRIVTSQDGTIIGYDMGVTMLDPNNNPGNPNDSNTGSNGWYATGGGGSSRGGGSGRYGHRGGEMTWRRRRKKPCYAW